MHKVGLDLLIGGKVMRNFAIFGLLFTIVLVVIAAIYKKNQEILEDYSATVEHTDKD
jgi:hypothetical protein